MVELALNKGEQMLFALLRGSLHNVEVIPEYFIGATQQDWKLCYNTAVKQGVLALAWDGLLLLPEDIYPPKPLKLQWGLSVQKYEQKHRLYCSTVEQLQNFYKENGIIAVQMKGVGFSHHYNHPEHREGGDIDIYTYSADESKMGHKEANSKADDLMILQGIEVDTSHSEKHSNFYYKGIPVENHKWFVNIETNPKFLGKLNDILLGVLNPHKVSMLGGECELLVPSEQFNTIFIACHAFQHFGSGIALHHLYDWATLISKYGLVLPDSISEVTFRRAVAALTHLSNIYLGTDIDLSEYPKGYEKLAQQMLNEMLYPKFSKVVPYRNPFKILWYKYKRVSYANSLRSKTLEANALYLVLRSVYWHLRYPATIFTRGDK